MNKEPDPAPTPPPPTPEQFRQFARRLLSVPKRELDRKLAQEKAAKKKPRRRPS